MQFELPLDNPTDREAPDRESLRPRDAEAENEAVPVTDSAPETSFEELSPDELAALYHKEVGIDPRLRGFSVSDMITGLENPDAERERIRQIDTESDREDVLRTYRT